MTSAERFREHMAGASEADPAVAALVEEAARIMDRLDQIDGIVTGKSEWIELMHFRVSPQSETVTVTIDGVLAEARQQAAALKSLLQQLGLGKADLAAKEKVVDPLDQIAARRAARGGSTARPRRTGAGSS